MVFLLGNVIIERAREERARASERSPVRLGIHVPLFESNAINRTN